MELLIEILFIKFIIKRNNGRSYKRSFTSFIFEFLKKFDLIKSYISLINHTHELKR